jgi:hypothetical protein
VLKNAIDYLYGEWNNKAAGFVSYGSLGGARAIEHLRAISSELQIAHVRQQVSFSLFNDFENFSTFKPAPSTTTRPRPCSTSSSPGPARSRPSAAEHRPPTALNAVPARPHSAVGPVLSAPSAP